MFGINAGKVLVIGACQLGGHTLHTVACEYGMKVKDFKFIEYNKVTNYDFNKLLHTNKYIDIFVGAVPHSAKRIAGYNSPLEFLAAHENELPQVQYLRRDNRQLGLTKANFEKAVVKSAKFAIETFYEDKYGLLC